MKRRIQITLAIPLIGLMLLFSVFSMFFQPLNSSSAISGTKTEAELNQEKFTILPFIISGGIQFLKKAVKKKQAL
jgi:hypothetical protein